MRAAAAALKRLERTWRGLWIRVLTRLMRRSGRVERPDWGARPHRVLFLRHDRIGDMILSTGLVRVIATSHRTITLDVLASPLNAPVLREDPSVGSVVVFDRKKPFSYVDTLRRLRTARYDAVIDCMPTAPSLTTLLLMLASGARHRIGVAGRGNDAAFTLLVRPTPGATHIVDQLAALAAAFDVDPGSADFRPRLYLTDGERSQASATWRTHGAEGSRRRFLVNVSSGRAFRRWPDHRFVTAIRHVLARDPELAVAVIGGPAEWNRAAAIARDAGVPFVRTATLREALALVASADLLFTPDTGLAHAASAFARPAVIMHISGTAAQWGPYGAPGHALASPGPSLASLPVEPVLQALERLLGEQVAPQARAFAGG
ncbi:MAG: glycosyltransferase family 9 protein [Gemmatimonadaceae bacterium]